MISGDGFIDKDRSWAKIFRTCPSGMLMSELLALVLLVKELRITGSSYICIRTSVQRHIENPRTACRIKDKLQTKELFK